MATGKRAFQRESSVQTLSAIIEDQPEPPAGLNPQIPHGVLATIQRCLAKAPESRYESTRDLVKDMKVVQALSTAPTPLRSSQSSIAVLPFANMSTDPEQEYFCDGMAEEIINALTLRRYMERLRPV
jgi:serine/threonine protein kinase